MKLRVLPQQGHVNQPIGVAGENDSPGIASLRNMMGCIDSDDTREASHGDDDIKEVVRGK